MYEWQSIGIGVAAVLLLWILIGGITHNWKWPGVAIDGKDGRPSTSKFQFYFWTALILWGYVTVFARIALDDIPEGFSSPDVPEHLFWLMGLSVGTALSAKAITQIRGKPPGVARLGAGDPDRSLSSLVQDDNNRPALEKIQIMAWTLVAGGVFIVLVVNSITSSHVPDSLPDVDTVLLVLTGISQGGYIGTKAVAQAGSTPPANDGPAGVTTRDDTDSL